MDDIVLNGVVTLLTTLVGVLVGGYLTYKVNIKSQEEIIKKEIILNKLDETKLCVSNFLRGIALIYLNLNGYARGNRDRETFIEEDNKGQEHVRVAISNLSLSRVYVEDIYDEIERCIDKYSELSNIIYDKYHFGTTIDKDSDIFMIICCEYERLLSDVKKVIEIIDENIKKEVKIQNNNRVV